MDSGVVCGNFDSCATDAENDADSDGTCGGVDFCSYDSLDDLDNDELCVDTDSCPADGGNDADSDNTCRNEDECPYDVDDDADSDNMCVLTSQNRPWRVGESEWRRFREHRAWNQASRVDVFTLQVLMVPVHDGRLHWGIVCVYPRQRVVCCFTKVGLRGVSIGSGDRSRAATFWTFSRWSGVHGADSRRNSGSGPWWTTYSHPCHSKTTVCLAAFLHALSR